VGEGSRAADVTNVYGAAYECESISCPAAKVDDSTLFANVFGSLLCVDADDTHTFCGDDGFTYKVADARVVARKEERIG
jgi:hypothetical protein